MDDKTCPVCKLRCSRKDVMLRHYRNKNGITSLKRRDAVPQIEGYTPPPPPLTSLYPYRAYIEILLSYGTAAKESQLTGVMWYKDTSGHQDKRATDNKGFTSRKALTAQSKYVQMSGILHLDLFCQETRRVRPNGLCRQL